jgi:hypothetical protein
MPGSIELSGMLAESSVDDGIEADGFILSAVPGGSETIQAIGPYSLQATATSDGGTSAPASREFTVNYAISPEAPHLTDTQLVWDKSENSQGKCDKSQHGDMQIKFTANAVQPADTTTTDNWLEAFIHDESVIVEIRANADDSLLLERNYGTDNSTDVAISGATGDDEGQYFTKVDLCGATTGDYTIYVYFDDHSDIPYLQYTKAFTLQN